MTIPLQRSWAPLCAAVVLFATLSCSKPAAPPPEAAGTASGDAPVVELLKEPMDVPAFTLNDLDGKPIPLDQYKGKVILVNFWATWCPPCRAEIPDLIKLQEKYKDKLVVLGISEDEVSPQEVQAFATAQKMNYPVAMTTPEIAKIFKGVSALPTTFIIDREGRVQVRHVGMLDPERTELETQYLTGAITNVKVERVEDETKALITKAAQAKEIPGVDLTKLTAEQRSEALAALNSENCTCGCELTLAACRINDPSCSVSLPIAQKMVEQIAKGQKRAASTTQQ